MTYSCSDFTDDIMRTLGVQIDDSDDDGLDRVEEASTIACREIERLQEAEKDAVDARQLAADLFAYLEARFEPIPYGTYSGLVERVEKMKLPDPTISL